MKVVNDTAPRKEIKIKNNTQEWFDREIAELIYAREKLFLKTKKSNSWRKLGKSQVLGSLLLGKRKENPKRLIVDKK